MKKSIRIIIVLIITMSISTASSFGTSNYQNESETKNPSPIHIETIGEGKPILYLPGFTVPGSIWKETIKNLDLSRKSYLVSYAGFNGHAPIEMPWYDSIKKAIIDYVRENNLSEVLIVGHSMGGNLAVDIAAELPNSVSKIVIVDALPCMRELMMPNVSAESLQYESPYNMQILEMDDDQFKEMAVMMAANMTFNSEKKDSLSKWIEEADRKTWAYGYTDLLKLDLRDTLSKIKCETLIVGASFPSKEIAENNFEKQYKNLPNKIIKMASNSKHFIMLDQSQWFYSTLNNFLANESR